MDKSKIKDFILDFVFPNRCPLCGEVIRWNIPYCEECYDNLPWTGTELCNGCGNISEQCSCDEKLLFTRCYAAFYYKDCARSAVIYLKNTENTIFPQIIAEKIYDDIRRDAYTFKLDFIVPIPMAKIKKNIRGYNQAAVIGQALSDYLKVPMREDVLKRHNSLFAQHELSADLRHLSAETKYYSGNNFDIQGKTILLCDDVMTTGSTVNECSKILIAMGAAKVIIAVAATTIK